MQVSLAVECLKQNKRNIESLVIIYGFAQDYSRLQNDRNKNFHKVQDLIEITGELVANAMTV